MGYTYLTKCLQTLWHPKAKMEIVALEEDYFLVKFNSITDYEFAKYGEPWMILEHYLTVQDWRPNFDPHTDKTERVLVWVHFPDLPVEYFDYNFLMRIGELIGEPKNIDEATSLVSRGRFARMCIEVDITKPLLSKYKLRRRVRRIEYEGIHLVCFNCGTYGHREEQCSGKDQHHGFSGDGQTTGERPEKATEGDDSVVVVGNGKNYTTRESLKIRPEIVDSYGPWMLAPRRGGRKSGFLRGKENGEKRQNQGADEKVAGKEIRQDYSRYAVLAENEEHDTVSYKEEANSKTKKDQEEKYTSDGLGSKLKNKGKRPAV